MRRYLSKKHAGVWALLGAGLMITLVLVVLSPWASTSPDGLEKVARDKGFESKAVPGEAPMKDYRLPGVNSEATSTRISGAVGAVITLVVALAIGFAAVWLGKRKRSALMSPAPAGRDPEKGGPDEA
jgi:ABC-type Fe3+ transport system permease subunit